MKDTNSSLGYTLLQMIRHLRCAGLFAVARQSVEAGESVANWAFVGGELVMVTEGGSVFGNSHDFPPGSVFLWIEPAFERLAGQILEYERSGGGVAPFVRESVLGRHSYARATGDGGQMLTWQRAFAEDMNHWRCARHTERLRL